MILRFVLKLGKFFLLVIAACILLELLSIGVLFFILLDLNRKDRTPAWDNSNLLFSVFLTWPIFIFDILFLSGDR